MSSVDVSSAPTDVAYILNMPPEVLIKIMEQMTPTTLSNFVLSCKGFFEIFEEHKHSIMVNILKGLPEFNTMLHLYTADKEELHPSRMLRPRIIDFEAGSFVQNLMDTNIDSDSTIVPCSVTKNYYLLPGEVPKFTFKPAEVMGLWNMVTVVDWWVELYPRLRWRDAPLIRRCLRDSEEVRLRKAVANWWLYAHYHHGFAYTYRNFQQPKRWSDDTRLQQIRTMSTDEICEMRDFWLAVKSTVSLDLCSSPERVCLCEGTDRVDLVPWGERESRHSTIVDTYSKLDPQLLKYYLTYYANWKRTETASTISQCSREFHRDTETLSLSMHKVISERVIVEGIVDPQDIPRFGILDGSGMDPHRAERWMNDAWSDGKVPLTQAQIDSLPQDPSALVARGDDGTDACCPY